jgi:cytochrome c oxidase subunit 2
MRRVPVFLGVGAWLWLCVTLAPTAAAQDHARGRELFGLCAQCHMENGAGDPMTLAPSIAGLEQWYVEAQLHKFRDGWRGAHFDDLAGMRMRPMARWLKTDDDIRAVAAYVTSLPAAPPPATLAGGDPARGAPIYAACAGCHGAMGEGNQAVGAPSLRLTSDWYQLKQLKNFKQGIRGGDPRDVTGVAMRPMSMILADEQLMKDVLAHIWSLPRPTAGSE